MNINFKYHKYNLGKNPSLHLKKLLLFMKRKKIIRILDFGCGNGRNSFFFKNKGFNVSAIDSKKIITKYKNYFMEMNIPLKPYSANTIKTPFKSNLFGCIIAWRVLHRGLKKYRQKLIKELYRILKKDGYFILYHEKR